MQKFKLVIEETGQEIKKYKKERTEDLKAIKQLYQELQQKQRNPFGQAVDRITKNLTFFKENEYKAAHTTINAAEIVHKYEAKMQKINDQIFKLDQVIKNGCGSIVQKSQSSRISNPLPSAERSEISQLEVIQSTLKDNGQRQ